jgi:hypothetical protein
MILIDRMMDHMLSKMNKEEEQAMIEKMMDKFFADMTVEDKQKLMEE